MPGPGPHLLYTLGSAQAMMSISNGRFSPHHCLVYSINAFFGPDIGSFSEWLTSTLGLGHDLGSLIESLIHDPFYYTLILGAPLSFFYSWVSGIFLRKQLLHSISGVPLTRRQCFFLLSAGALSHFFLDHLFEENGQSSMYKWILSTGWWETQAPVTLHAVIVTSFLCIVLIVGFTYIHRTKSSKSLRSKSSLSAKLLLAIGALYSMWCASQTYLVTPRRPAVGEEADLGVLVLFGTYFFLPHWLCIMSMNSKEDLESAERLPN